MVTTSFPQGNPSLLDDVWAPFFTFSQYQRNLNTICGDDMSDVQKFLYYNVYDIIIDSTNDVQIDKQNSSTNYQL